MKFILNSLEKSWKNWKKSWINWKKSWINWEKNLLAPKKNSTRVLLSVLQRGWLHPCSRLIFYLINFYQLSAAVDSWWQLIWIKLTGIFLYTLLVISLPNFSSLGWFLFSSAFDGCYQLLTADDSCHEKNQLEFSSTP